LNFASVPYCQHVVVTKLVYKENKRDITITRLFQISFYYIIPILGHFTLKSYAKRSNKQIKGNQKAREGSQDHIMKNYSNKCKYHEDPKAS
jgi:hypothetical protein